jgi:hypothetical protein
MNMPRSPVPRRLAFAFADRLAEILPIWDWRASDRRLRRIQTCDNTLSSPTIPAAAERPRGFRICQEARSSPRLRRQAKPSGPIKRPQARTRRTLNLIEVRERDQQAAQDPSRSSLRLVSTSPPYRCFACKNSGHQSDTFYPDKSVSLREIAPNPANIVTCCTEDAIHH